jgi:hypothetical protein
MTPSDRRHVSQTVELIKVREHHLYLSQVAVQSGLDCYDGISGDELPYPFAADKILL